VALGRRPELQPDRRRPGGLRVADDDAADLPGRSELRHALGRLARGRAGVLLREVHRRRRGPAPHTLERFRECFYRPLLSSTENFERWKKNGSLDAAARAGNIWRKTIEEYEQPPLDEAIRSELEAYVTRRRAELGD
jgi:hypothetical protein